MYYRLKSYNQFVLVVRKIGQITEWTRFPGNFDASPEVTVVDQYNFVYIEAVWTVLGHMEQCVISSSYNV